MPKSPIQTPATDREKGLVDALAFEFGEILGTQWTVPHDLETSCIRFMDDHQAAEMPASAWRKRLLALIAAQKFRTNAAALQILYDAAAADRLFFDAREKRILERLFLAKNENAYMRWAQGKASGFPWLCYFTPAPDDEVLGFVREQLLNATINRSDARKEVQSERRESILRSLFGAWFVKCLSPETSEGNQAAPHTSASIPANSSEKNGAAHFRIPADWFSKWSAAGMADWLRAMLDQAYDTLKNHRCCTVTIDLDGTAHCRSTAWELAGDITVFAERMREEKLEAGFFHPEKIAASTVGHISEVDVRKARFDLHCSGFAFKDCLLFTNEELRREGAESSVSTIVLLFEKNVADETPVPCPACGSLDVRGNSYPTLGVKSWECQNLLCPERSAFDRGNRFTPAALERAALGLVSDALIPDEHIRLWKLDLLHQTRRAQLFEMLIRHFSVPGEVIRACNWDESNIASLGRVIQCGSSSPTPERGSQRKLRLWDSPFFQRYLTVPNSFKRRGFAKMPDTPDWLDLYCGSCAEVLDQLPPASVDGAVTSPPYYNAREYATWPNIYCYYYDMKVAAAKVFEALKPGGVYLFNVFDYFDNENTAAFSAMGKRRIPLGAYITQVFVECGFEVAGNIAWFKGEIEGKRSCNQGNRIPFHQLPLNTWEHVLIFRKPGPALITATFPDAIMQRPVLKWVRGENRHGHTAPFPESIPDLLCSRLPSGSTVLDPYAGSLTTASAAHRRGHRCIAIELHEHYCHLGLDHLNRRSAGTRQLALPLIGWHEHHSKASCSTLETR